MGSGEWTLRGRRVVTPDGTRPADILIAGGRIAVVATHGASPAGATVVDVGDRVVLPGLVDVHVHINEPGRTDWEGFATATRAAAGGGITTVVDMPLNSSPVTTTVEALAAKTSAAEGKLWVDCGFHGGLVPGNADQVGPLVAAGVLGFKAFLCDSGIDEFPAVAEADLREAIPAIVRSGLPLLAHAEVVGPTPEGIADDPRSYAAHLAGRPATWEVDAIQLLIDLCRSTGGRVHVVHLSTPEAFPLIAAAKAEGLPITVETCPHYLLFAAEEIPDGDPRFKCTPPIRNASARDGLWDGLRSGLIDTIGSDHSPAPPDLKHLDTGDVRAAWGGISSLQVSLAAVWTEAHRRGFALDDLARWMAMRPADLVGLSGRKGSIAAGRDADLVVFDPDRTFVVEGHRLEHRHPATPYEGRTLRGVVEATFVRGSQAYDSGVFFPEPRGRIIVPARIQEDGGLARFNKRPSAEARAALLRCCGSTWWADQMAEARPFASEEAIDRAATRIWDALGRDDRLEAFAAHPRIGDLEALRARFAATADLASAEQGGMVGASDDLLGELAEGNRAYEARFGHVFLVCATGKSAAEMLSILGERLPNDPEAEFVIASAEQAKITRLRLGKLIS